MKGLEMKVLDIAAAVLLVVGGLNWGLVGVFEFDLVATIFGASAFLARLVYTLVGLAALYDIIMVRSIWKRWQIHFRRPVHA